MESADDGSMSRAKLLQLWKASRKKQTDEALRAEGSRSLSPTSSRASNPSTPRGTSKMTGVSSFYRSIFDSSGRHNQPAGSQPQLLTPMRPVPSPDVPIKKLPATKLDAAIHRDATLQSLADKVSSLLPPTPPQGYPSASRLRHTSGAPSGRSSLKTPVNSPRSSEDSSEPGAPSLRQAYTQTRERLLHTESLLSHIREEYAHLKTKVVENENRISMAVEEHQALGFLIEVQSQTIREYEGAISSSRLKHNEALSEKTKRHRAEIKRLNAERVDYEDRAEGLFAQLNEQMNSLQSMAMARIDELESELMSERRRSSELESRLARWTDGERREDGVAGPMWKGQPPKTPPQSKGEDEDEYEDEDGEEEDRKQDSGSEGTPSRKGGRRGRRDTLKAESKTSGDGDYLDEI